MALSASSTMPPRYITAMRWLMCSTTGRSWAMKSRRAGTPAAARAKVDHLGLDRDVERRDRLVAHDQSRVERQRAGGTDPLALAAGGLVRVVRHELRRQPDPLEQRRDPLLPLDRERLADDGARRHPPVERRVGPGSRSASRDGTAHLPVAELRDVPSPLRRVPARRSGTGRTRARSTGGTRSPAGCGRGGRRLPIVARAPAGSPLRARWPMP